jgi:hypothetical protein
MNDSMGYKYLDKSGLAQTREVKKIIPKPEISGLTTRK